MTNLHLACAALSRKLLRLPSLFIIVISVGGAIPPAHAQTEREVVAVVNDRQITEKEVDASIVSQLLPLQQQIYELRKKALDNLILRAILDVEARKRGIAVEELKKQLTAVKVEVSPSEVEQIYLENASAFAAMSPDEAKERIRLDLESQARMRNYREALSKLKVAAAINIRLEEPRLPFISKDDSSPSQGPKEAKVTITEFSDFQCSYCRTVQPAIKRVLQEYKDSVRLIFKHLPLTDIHPQALPSARAAFCAGQQGAFWQYHDALFASEDLSPEALDKAAGQLGINLPRFKSCLDSKESSAAILKDVQEAKRIGINSTPAFIINGKLISGAISFEEFKGLIERELKSAQSAYHSP